MDFKFSQKSLELQEKMNKFFEEHIFPNEEAYEKAILDSGDPLHIPKLLDELKDKARKEDLWNLFLPDNEYGAGLTNVDYAPLAEITGQVWWAPEVFNCSAPDTGNMEILAEFGTQEQKDRFLPGIINNDVWWCQGYSEPGSGSDLASLKTKAVKDGDHYIVNGTKTWTTMAQHADWIFCLVRTETTDIKQQGISFLLIDMKTPGVEVKPIITIDGSHEVNMVYLDNVKVPVENLIGEEGAGWNIAKFLLAHERTGIGGIPALKREIRRIREITSELPLGEGFLKDDELFMDKLNKLEIDLLAAEYSELRTLAAMAKGGHPGPESSILKIKGTDLQQGLSDLFVEALGYYAHPFMSEDDLISNEGRIGPDFAANVMPHYLNYRKVSIYGGSNEIQRNVIAKAVLGI